MECPMSRKTIHAPTQGRVVLFDAAHLRRPSRNLIVPDTEVPGGSPSAAASDFDDVDTVVPGMTPGMTHASAGQQPWRAE
jgi:hypothetical protein